jgi:hypothetical protein
VVEGSQEQPHFQLRTRILDPIQGGHLNHDTRGHIGMLALAPSMSRVPFAQTNSAFCNVTCRPLTLWPRSLGPRPYRALGVILMRERISETDEHPVAHIFSDEAVEPVDSLRDALVIGSDHKARVLGGELG